MSPKLFRVLLIGAVLLLVAAQSALADNVYATIRGVVTDPTGAVVAGVQVTATNTSTGVSRTTTSQPNGLYEFLQLPVGPYSVSVSKEGFKTYKSSGIQLAVNQVYDLPVKLEVGTKTETVEVKADAVQVETTSIQQSTLINSAQIVDLPLNGRNFTQLEQLAPGVMASNDRFGTFSVNGSQTQQSSYLVNGTDSNDIALNTPGLLPSPDAIQEFNLISSTINPEYGRNSGGIVNAVIKSGTNSYHGGIFDFYRDTFLNARNFFTVGPQQPIFHQNQFGGTFGGPIKKDNTFFFLSYQGTYNAVASPTVTTVLSDAQRGGFFPDIANSAAKSPIPLQGEDGIVHPAGTPYGGATGLFPTGHIPLADFNSISAGLLNQFVPHANAPSNGFSFSPFNTGKTDQGIAKVDHNFGSNNQIWGLFAENNNRSTQALPFTGATLPGFNTFSTANTKEITAAWTHTFSASALNEFRLGWFHLNFDAVEPATTAAPSTFGFTNIIPQNPKANQLPVISLASAGLFTLGFSDNGPQPRKDQNYQLTDNFTKVMGRHTLKFGFDGRRFQVDNPFFARVDGHFDFGTGNGKFSTGNAAADFLLGFPDDYNQGSGAVINARAYEYYAYGQDQWKMRSNLTLTYGAGYQIDTPYNNNQFGGKAFNCLIPGQETTIFPPKGPDPVTGNPTGAPVGMNFPGDPGCTQSGTTIKYGHIGPRLGFAYSPQWGGKLTNGQANKTSIRGGFGFYFNRYEEETALQNLGAPPFGITSSGAGDFGGFPQFANPWVAVNTGTAPAGFPTNKFPFVPPAPGAPVDFTFFEPMSNNTNSPTLSTPYSMNFNLNIQREFPGNTVVSLGYVGALGRHLYRAYEADPITLAGESACKIDPGCVADRAFQHADFPSHTLLGDPAYGSWGTQFTDGTSNYNALQFNVTKGMSHGLQLITSYTWSHSIDNGSGFESSGFGIRGTNPFFPNLNVGDSGQDARQRLVLGYIYALPNLVHHGFAERLVNGWKITGISTFQSGFPFNISTSAFSSLTCDIFSFYGCDDVPNQISAVSTVDPRTSKFGTKNDYWFNPADFANVPKCLFTPGGVAINGNVCGTFGNAGRNSVHGPGILNSDLALIKDTKIAEGKNLQVGIEAFNVFNHAQFSNPSGNVNSGNFGRILSTQIAPRIVQLRAKFNF